MATSPRSPARLLELDDLMRQIFLRLPPGDPGALVRAAAGCRSWRGILSNAAFARDYRKLHGAPPMLGFFYEELFPPKGRDEDDEAYWLAHFVSTATFRPPACQDRPYWHVLDSRHGLVLFYTPRKTADFVVVDLLTDDRWKIDANLKCRDIMWWDSEEEEEKKLERLRCNAAVLCAKDRCDHLDCHGGPFRIALVGCVEDGSKARATVYSSEASEWSDIIEAETPDYIDGLGHSAVVGNNVYVPCLESDSVVEYNMGEQELCVIDHPFEDERQPYLELMGVEDGMLLFASVLEPRLYLWSMGVGPNRAAGWARSRVIELEQSLPPGVLSDWWGVSAVGFAEGVSVIFLKTTRNWLYTIDLNSGEGKKVHQRSIAKVMPYMSFYTGEWGQLLISQ